MRNFLFSLVAIWVCALTYSKIIFESFETNANPKYATIVRNVREKDGEQYVDIDLNITKDVPSVSMHTTIISMKIDGEYLEILTLGPIDPCSENDRFGDHQRKQHDHMAKHGNMSFHLMCPFKKGYFYTRDMKVNFNDDLPPDMIPGQYRFVFQATIEENGEEVFLMNEKFYFRIE